MDYNENNDESDYSFDSEIDFLDHEMIKVNTMKGEEYKEEEEIEDLEDILSEKLPNEENMDFPFKSHCYKIAKTKYKKKKKQIDEEVEIEEGEDLQFDNVQNQNDRINYVEFKPKLEDSTFEFKLSDLNEDFILDAKRLANINSYLIFLKKKIKSSDKNKQLKNKYCLELIELIKKLNFMLDIKKSSTQLKNR